MTLKTDCRRRHIRSGIAVLLLALFLLGTVSPGETDAHYLVKLQEDTAPFRVVGQEEMRRLRAAGALEWYEPEGELTLFEDASAPCYSEDKWDLALVRAEAAFERGFLGKGVRIGVLDSGINPLPELADRLLPGRCCIEGAEEDDTADIYGHGTQIAALLAGAGKDGNIGVAPEAQLVPLKITDGKAILVSTLCTAIYAAIDEYDCRILNLSLGITKEYQALAEAIAYAEEKGVLVVSAVGNNGTEGIIYPAAYETAVGVGSVDRDGYRYRRSNHNESVFLTAPGVNVKTLGSYGGYVTSTGTSFAVPYVTAAAAVLLGMDPALTPAEMRSILAETAEDKGAPGWDGEYGWGILDIRGCVEALESRKEAVFTDLPEGAWYLEGIRWAVENGVMKGVGDGRFAPEETASRAMLVTVLHRLTGNPQGEGGADFTDVAAEAWYGEAVRWAAEAGIVNGYGDGSFRPGEALTREQLAAILYRYARTLESFTETRETSLDYADAEDVSPWAYEALCWMTEQGILRGTEDGLLLPRASASRAQIAVMLMRFADRIP